MSNNAKKICSIFFGATVLAISSLAHAQKDLDRQEAAKAITESEAFRRCDKGTCIWAIYTGRWNLIADHWASTAAHPQPDNLKGSPVGYWLYTNGYLQLLPNDLLTLSDKGRIAAKDWKHVTAPGREAETSQTNYEGWDIPLATKSFVVITGVFKGWRMGVQFAEVNYLWSYALTPLGSELFKTERLPSNKKKAGGWIAPAELTGIEPNKTFSGKATFVLHREGWRLNPDCKTVDACD
ncbi:MAG TPA: hypothetical protein VGR48_04805 [Terriglobales bacterium]|nr:hypothetical protein [Terriglobales bacterium]